MRLAARSMDGICFAAWAIPGQHQQNKRVGGMTLKVGTGGRAGKTALMSFVPVSRMVGARDGLIRTRTIEGSSALFDLSIPGRTVLLGRADGVLTN